MSRIRCVILSLILGIFYQQPVGALNITRYVAPGATGDGLSPETPTGNLQSVLESSARVDALTIYASPGTYTLNIHGDPDHYPTYRNVTIFGGGRDKSTGELIPMIITGSMPNFENSALYNISFEKGLGLNNSNSLKNCSVDGNIGITTRNSDDYITMLDCWASSINIYGARGSVVQMELCTIMQSDNWGLNAKNATIYARKCYFNYHKLGGVVIDGGKNSQFDQCQFLGNSGDGALTVIVISDDITAKINNCVFARNSSTVKNRSSAITALSPIAVRNSVFRNNRSGFDGKVSDNHEAAVSVSSPRSFFEGCTFIGNNGVALRYNVYPGNANPGYPQLENCVFYDNGTDIATPYGAEPTMIHCALEGGTGIPELDIQRGIIALNKSNAGLSEEGRIISPKSVLINAGEPYDALDADGNSRQLLGGTDLGAYEYSGQWEVPDDGAQKIKCGDNEYVETSCYFGGNEFKALMPLSAVDDSSAYADINSEWLYLGEQAAPFKIVNDAYILHYLKVPGGRTWAFLSALDRYNEWVNIAAKEYSGKAPIAREVDGKWTLITPTTQQGSSSAKKSTPLVTKKPATHRSGPAVRPK